MHLQIKKEQQHLTAVETLQRGGSLLEVFTPEEPSEFFSHASKIFLPTILEPRFRRRKFYVPLLEANTVAGCNGFALLEDGFVGQASIFGRVAKIVPPESFVNLPFRNRIFEPRLNLRHEKWKVDGEL